MELIKDYFVSNYMTLTILSAVVVLMAVNRKEKIPASQLFTLMISLMVVITIGETVSLHAELAGNTDELILLHTVSEAVKYILRPVIIMLELFVIITQNKLKILYSIPAVINTVVFATALSGSRLAFYIDENNHWHKGSDLQYTVYLAQLIYVLLLLIHSISFFRRNNVKRSVIVFLIFVQSLGVAILEFNNISGFVNPVTALCILEYYIYLSTIYQQEIREEVARKELDLMKSDLMILRNQLQPHFIYNTLNIIRYLIKTDPSAALRCVDSFSKYLKAHIKALRSEDLIPFEQELENVKDYIRLVQIDYTRKIDTVYELETTDFMIPPLSLEPIVENAIDHGLGRKGGTVTLRTAFADGNVTVIVKDSGSSGNKPDEYEPIHNGVGLENTRRRIELQCSGSLVLDINENGAEVTITLPQNAPER